MVERAMSEGLRERIAQALHDQRGKRYHQHPSALKDCVAEYQRDTFGDADAILALDLDSPNRRVIAELTALLGLTGEVDLVGAVRGLREKNEALKDHGATLVNDIQKTIAERERAYADVASEHREVLALRAQLAAAERERDEARRLIVKLTDEVIHACPAGQIVKRWVMGAREQALTPTAPTNG